MISDLGENVVLLFLGGGKGSVTATTPASTRVLVLHQVVGPGLVDRRSQAAAGEVVLEKEVLPASISYRSEGVLPGVPRTPENGDCVFNLNSVLPNHEFQGQGGLVPLSSASAALSRHKMSRGRRTPRC